MHSSRFYVVYEDVYNTGNVNHRYGIQKLPYTGSDRRGPLTCAAHLDKRYMRVFQDVTPSRRTAGRDVMSGVVSY